MTIPTFSASGLASGLDSGSIIDQLVKIESQPINLLRSRQSALKTQVSIMGDIASKLTTLNTAAKALGDTGLLAVQPASSNTSFSVTTAPSTSAGSYSVEVKALAVAAKARSAGFTSGAAEAKAGTLTLEVQGSTYTINIAAGDTLAGVADAIKSSGAPVSASLISDGTNTYLSVTNSKTGFPLTGTAADALKITESYTGSTGQALGLANINTAANASLEVDGLPIASMTNDVADVIPGVTLKALSVSGPEDLVLSPDVDGTAKRVQTFIDAYNDVMKVIHGQLTIDATTDRSSTLAGDAAIRGLQQRLSGLISTQVGGLVDVRALADLGVKTARDGSLSLDKDILSKAMVRSPSSVNALFSQASTGLTSATTSLVEGYTQSTSGIISIRQAGLAKTISAMDDQAVRMQDRIDAYRKNLSAQYTAMENIVSGLKAIGNFLTQNAASNSGSNK